MAGPLDLQGLPEGLKEAAARIAGGGNCISVLSVVEAQSARSPTPIGGVKTMAAQPASARSTGADLMSGGNCISVLSVVSGDQA